MIKGTNKQILEVTNPESPYFEKIIFFVRPQGQAIGNERLNEEAKRLSLKMKKPPRAKRSARQIFQAIGMLVLGVGAGASTALILNTLI